MPQTDASAAAIPAMRDQILAWYRHNRRDLPWRGETDPYRIWISEVMLQQTQVSTVIPYYRRFLAKFGDLEILAAAPLAEVLKAWQGLGYYARARNLHKAAIELVDQHAGRFPESYAGLRTLPGFGDYTAGAVASIAFGQAVVAVDGNVKRVIARLFAVDEEISRAPAARRVKELATALIDPDAPGDWTQAIMELGATICLPKSPKCLFCPVAGLCQGRLRGIELELPVKPARKSLPHYEVAAAVIVQDGKLLVAQRPLDGMLGGLWEFPGGKQEADETLAECLRREIREELDIEIDVGRLVVSVKHSYTHFKITLHAFYCSLVEGDPRCLGVADWRWTTLDDIDVLPFPRTDSKIIEALRDQLGQPTP